MDKSLVLTQAKNATMSNDFVNAARLYKELLRGEPTNVEYLRELGNIYVKSGNDEKAIPYYEQIINLYPHHIDSMTSLGAIYRRLKRYEKSISILQRALDEGRQAATVNYNLGFTYKEMGNYEDAIDAFNLVIHLNPDDVLAYNHLGSIYLAQKEYDKSIASYKKGLQIDKNHPILNYNLARCYEAAKIYPEAVRCYQAALKTKPAWLDAIQDFSKLLIKGQKNKEAADLVQQSIKLHPNDVSLLNLLGRVYLNEYDYDAAEKTYKKAKSMKDDDIQILSGLAEALEKGDKVEQAMDNVLSALELEPENKDIKKQYAHTLLSAKDYDAAHEQIKELYEDNGQRDVQVLDLYGQYYICTDDEEKAKSYYSKIKTINHHYKDYMLNAAKRSIQVNKLDSAEAYSNDYIRQRPENTAGYVMMGQVLNQKGDFEGAKANFEKSVSLNSPNALASKHIQTIKTKIENQNAPSLPTEAPVVEQESSVSEESVENQIAEEQNEGGEEFDFSQMGDNVPFQEKLVEEDEEFWDDMEDEEPENSEEETDEETEVENTEEDNEEIIPTDEEPFVFMPEEEPVEDFDFGDIPEDKSFDEQLKQDEEEVPEETPIQEDDFSEEEPAFEMPSLPESEPEQEPEPEFEAEPEPEPALQIPPKTEPLPKPQPQYQPEPAYNPSLDRQMQQAAMNAAFTAQSLAQQLADQQKKMQEENEKLIKEQVEKAVDEKFQELDLPAEPVEEKNEPQIEETPAETEDDYLDDDFDFSPVDDFMSEDDNNDETEDTDDEFIDDDITFTSVCDYDSEIETEQTEEDALPTEDFQFATVDDFIDEASEEQVNTNTDEEENQAESEINLSVEDMLEKIERILKDDDSAKQYSEEIEMFKKLRILTDYLPESEKKTFLSGKIRMLIEYIIAKMSGKPGLLITAQSLIKSGVLGEEYNKNLEYHGELELSNELIGSVLRTMKKMSGDLEDKTLAEALSASADHILEKIELINQKSQIFS